MGKSAGRVIATVFWDCKGVLWVDFMANGTTISAVSYWETLELLQAAIKQQCPGLLTTGVLFLHVDTQSMSQLQHNSCSTSDGQSWNICHTAQIWRQVIFTSFLLLRIIFLATSLQVTVT
jgi:hypothetical protein